MKKQLIFVCLSFMFLGFGLSLFIFGDRALINLEVSAIIYGISLLAYFIVGFTYLQEIKDELGIND